MSQIEPGTVLSGRYSLTRRLTSPETRPQRWAANDSTLKRDVVVVLFPQDDPHAGAALDSARRVASMVDTRLARVLDVGEHEDQSFVVIESLEHAETLTQRIQDGHIHPEEARRIIGEAASALESARLRGLHHQLLTPGSVRIAKDGSVSVSGVATAAALDGLDDTASAEASRKDTVALVACLFAALTGSWPLTDHERTSLPAADRHRDGSLQMPAEVEANIPHDLDDLCHDTLPLEEGDDPQADPGYRGPRTPGDLARLLAPWSADPITAADAHLDHVAAPMLAQDESRAEQAEGSWADDVWADDELGYEDGYDEDYEDDDVEKRPLPTAAGASGPSRAQTWGSLGLVAAFVLVAALLAYLGVRTLKNDLASPASTGTGRVRTSTNEGPLPVPTSSAPKTTSTPAGNTPIPVIQARVTQARDSESSTSVLIDGDTKTVWKSLYWSQQDRSHRPVGIILDLGSEKSVKGVSTTFPAGTYSPAVYVSKTPGIEGATKIGESSGASGTWSATAESPAKGRYVVLWFTQASKLADTPFPGKYDYGVQISEVKVVG